MTEDEAFFESSQYGSTDFDYEAADPKDALVVFRKAAQFFHDIVAESRTPRAAQIRLAVAMWIFNSKRESVSAIARRLKVSRKRIRQVSEEMTAFSPK